MTPLKVTTRLDANNVHIQSDAFSMHLQVERDRPLEPASECAALWLALPIAMRLGRDLHICGRIDASSRDNAEHLAIIWSTWEPGFFHPIRVSADTICDPEPPTGRKETLMLYSGGMDSSYALCREFIERGMRTDALTIQGMDYKADDDTRFQALLKKTAPLRQAVIDRHFLLRSNVAQQMKRHGVLADIGHGFHLFGCLFLFESEYREGAIAADSKVELEYILAPWGTSTFTNDRFRSSNFGIRTLCNDVDRPAKARLLSNYPHALQSLSFCKHYDVRPENCGRCSKCIRSKATFELETGSIPDIFIDPAYSFDDVLALDLSNKENRIPATNLMMSAYRNQRFDEYRTLVERIALFSPHLQPKKQASLGRHLRRWKRSLGKRLGSD